MTYKKPRKEILTEAITTPQNCHLQPLVLKLTGFNYPVNKYIYRLQTFS